MERMGSNSIILAKFRFTSWLKADLRVRMPKGRNCVVLKVRIIPHVLHGTMSAL